MISWGLPAWLGGEESIHKDAAMYFLITSLSMPALGFNRLGTRMLQSCGNTKTPGILNSMNCLLDIIFNFIFIFSWHGFGFGLGVMGATWNNGGTDCHHNYYVLCIDVQNTDAF